MCALEKGAQGRIGFIKGGFRERRAGDQEEVGSGRKVRKDATHRGAQETLGAVPPHRVPDCPSGRHAHTDAGQVAGLCYQHNKRVGIRSSKTPHPLEVG